MANMMRVKPASSGRLKYTIAAGLSVALLLLYVLYRLADNDTRLRRLESSQAAGAGAVAAAAAAAAHKPVKGSSEQLITTSRQSTQDKPATAVKPIPQLNSRTDIAQLLESEGLTTGAELGVLVGDFAEHTLNIWQGCKTYYLVDLWAKQKNYVDLANSDDKEQELRYETTQKRLAPWEGKTQFKRMYTTEAAKQIPDNSLDYVYVDARHDYCGVMEDLQAYWPKLRSGGIFAGHDYIDAHYHALKATNQDWSVCMDGTVNFGAVKGAVNEFAEAHGLTVVATVADGDWPSWLIRKP
ncbi:hypothetical protein D9Q98_001106 [Chlorella vulgaris]|uniref:Uncharacterized protein n=1 Tax=Chlorella vulgaris TaxID=3077 RepID=A0A9D4Z343_CHLVU|nr:hypothetical protein D9Q98_001106 [Chlorella vulgaris]